MAMTLIQTQTADDDASLSFTSGIDSTYKLYIFKFYDVNPANDNTHFTFQGNASSQSGYNEVITSTSFSANHSEDDSGASIDYLTADDQANGTAVQVMFGNLGSDADSSMGGNLWLFNPSNTTYVKHWYSEVIGQRQDNMPRHQFSAGYFNVTAAITNIQFAQSEGNMDAVISMYGVG